METILLDCKDRHGRQRELLLAATGIRIRDKGAAIDSVGFDYDALPELWKTIKRVADSREVINHEGQ